MKSFIVDSFTEEAFKGNPAAVCIVNEDLSDDLMLSIAKEFNLSETAFIKENDDQYSIRYFSPVMEIPLCGHATLASAKVLFENYGLQEVHFITGDGLDLHVSKSVDDIVMRFPLYDLQPCEVPDDMLRALGVNDPIDVQYNAETKIILIEILHARLLAGLSPDFNALVKTHDEINGVLVTAQSEVDEFDFHSRYFWPWSGTNEDPVTGATHTFLAKYWSQKLEKKTLSSFQASERTGHMDLEIIGEDELLIKGKAVIVFEGDLKL